MKEWTTLFCRDSDDREQSSDSYEDDSDDDYCTSDEEEQEDAKDYHKGKKLVLYCEVKTLEVTLCSSVTDSKPKT